MRGFFRNVQRSGYNHVPINNSENDPIQLNQIALIDRRLDGMPNLLAGANMARGEAYRHLVARGFRTQIKGVSIQEDNDWRSPRSLLAALAILLVRGFGEFALARTFSARRRGVHVPPRS
jgi:hypothetical protein